MNMMTQFDTETRNAESEGTLADGVGDLLTLLHLTPFVVTARVPKLVAETRVYSVFDREETRLAVVEKVGAFVEGAIALQASWFASTLAVQAAALEGRMRFSDYVRAVEDATASALTPTVRRMQENLDRLG